MEILAAAEVGVRNCSFGGALGFLVFVNVCLYAYFRALFWPCVRE